MSCATLQDTGVLTPSSLEVQVGSINGLFNLDEVKVFTALDKKRVTHTQQILSLQLHPLYASTAFPKQLSKTIDF